MFAFAIIHEDELFLARDPLGIKPLYCGERNGAFYFASEIKAISLVTDLIREFPAGHWYHSKKGWHSFYEIHEQPEHYKCEEDAIERVRETLSDAVKLRLVSDVPVGISLSGGLDSSIIAFLANQNIQGLHSFAVGMEGSDDLRAAKIVANELGTIHHERIYCEREMQEILPQVIYHLESFDPALVRSAIPNFFLAQLASQYVKVILTGEGADEIFAGYDYLWWYDNPVLLHKETLGITGALHNTNLQRTDRISMAFGLEARVPFLDTKSVELGLGLPAKWKIHRKGPPKNLLRRAFRSCLPEEIITRPKQKFSIGAGSSEIFAQKLEKEIPDENFLSDRARLLYQWNYRMPNKEALYYYRVMRQFYYDHWIFPTMGMSRSI